MTKNKFEIFVIIFLFVKIRKKCYSNDEKIYPEALSLLFNKFQEKVLTLTRKSYTNHLKALELLF